MKYKGCVLKTEFDLASHSSVDVKRLWNKEKGEEASEVDRGYFCLILTLEISVKLSVFFHGFAGGLWHS